MDDSAAPPWLDLAPGERVLRTGGAARYAVAQLPDGASVAGRLVLTDRRLVQRTARSTRLVDPVAARRPLWELALADVVDVQLVPRARGWARWLAGPARTTATAGVVDAAGARTLLRVRRSSAWAAEVAAAAGRGPLTGSTGWSGADAATAASWLPPPASRRDVAASVLAALLGLAAAAGVLAVVDHHDGSRDPGVVGQGVITLCLGFSLHLVRDAAATWWRYRRGRATRPGAP